MPPKRRGRSRGAGNSNCRGRGRGGAKGASKKAQKEESDFEDDDKQVSDEEKVFEKNRILSVMRYDFDRLLNDPAFEKVELVREIPPEDLTIQFLEESGHDYPLVFHCDPKDLGMKVPDPKTFSVNNVLEMVGGNREIEVVEVSGQGSVKMALSEFITYYNLPPQERKTLYNVLSLEFSLTPMADVVHGPKLVREIDWVENFWPDPLRQRYISFNRKKQYQLHQTYPKVQNYCLMSVQKCYTDFHIDFGGTSVWYHVLKGTKVFWLVEPTESNLRIYEEFTKCTDQTGFFGDVVDVCSRVVLHAGDTLLIPSGWIHAVYTPEDSVVFGGNFIHSYKISMQIRTYQGENRINISKKFRFPYLEELMIYVVAHLVKQFTGRKYLRPLRIEDCKYDYVGKYWIQNKGHHKPVEDFDYPCEPIVICDDDKDEEGESGVVNVIAMHAENSVYASAGFEEEALSSERTIAVSDSNQKTATPEDPTWLSDSTIFYHPAGVLHDLCGRATAAHRNAVGEEPDLMIDDEAIKTISPRLLIEYEKLCDHLRKKRLIDIPEGITQPASLLAAFQHVLEHRRYQLEDDGVELVAAPWRVRTKRPRKSSIYSQATISPPSQRKNPRISRRKSSSQEECQAKADETEKGIKSEQPLQIENVENDTASGGSSQAIRGEAGSAPTTKQEAEDIMEIDGLPLLEDDDQHQPVVKSEMKTDVLTDQAFGELVGTETDDKGSIEEELEELVEEEELDVVGVQDDETGKKSKKVDSKKKGKDDDRSESKTKIKEKKKEPAPIKKRTPSKHFLDEAIAAEKAKKKKHDPKKDKPQYVHGIPVAPIQDDPVVPNPYNYDPKAEIMKLGTGQLQSAYRKSRTNIAPPKDKKMYRLAHEDSEDRSEDAVASCSAISAKLSTDGPSTPLSISVKSSAAKRRMSEGATTISPVARASFIPRLSDSSPDERSQNLPSGSDLYSPSTSLPPRRQSNEYCMRFPSEISPQNGSGFRNRIQSTESTSNLNVQDQSSPRVYSPPFGTLLDDRSGNEFEQPGRTPYTPTSEPISRHSTPSWKARPLDPRWESNQSSQTASEKIDSKIAVSMLRDINVQFRKVNNSA